MSPAGHVIAGHFSKKPTLAPYRSPRGLVRNVAVYTVFYALIVSVAVLYGLTFVFLPLSLYVYLAIPLLFLALINVWALPAARGAPVNKLRFLLLAVTGLTLTWPEYLAFYIPGLPWISAVRIAAVPMALLLLLSLKSEDFANTIVTVWRESSNLCKAFLLFEIIQILTIALSPSIGSTINKTLNYIFVWTVPFLTALWFFSSDARTRKWETLILVIIVLQCVVGLLELWNQRILWADSIPFFLQVDRETLAEVLEGTFREGKYRVTSIYSVSLCLAELLACVTPFVLRRIFNADTVGKSVAWTALDLIVLVVIIVTRSRLGIAGWLLAHVAFVLFWGLKRWRFRRTDILGPAIGLAGSAGALLLLVAMFTVPAVRNRTIGGGSTGLSDMARKIQFEMMWPKLFDNPFGHGAGRSGDVLGYYIPGGRQSVDSYIITILLDYGVLGFIAFCAMLAFAVFLMIKVYWASKSQEIGIELAIGISLIVFAVIRCVLSQDDNMPLLFVLLGAAAALHARRNSSGVEEGHGDWAAEAPAAKLA